MKHPCQRNNPLLRSGTDRQSRIIDALDSDHFRVDERSLADFILFARRYAENIRFYGDGSNTNWVRFFEKDISVTLARLSSLPLKLTLAFKDDLVRYLKEAQTVPHDVLREYVALYLRLPLLLMSEVAECRALLPRGDALIATLEKWAQKEIQHNVLLLKSYVLGAQSEPLQGFVDKPLDRGLLNDDVNVASPLLVPEQILRLVSSGLWADEADQLFACFDSLDESALAAVTPDAAPFSTSASLLQQVDDALRYNLLVNAVENLLSALQVVMDNAARALELALERDDHEPAYGLWLTFIKLYQYPQDHLNGFSKRHLDFYYRDILQVSNQGKQPDLVPLVFELAKHKHEYLLPAGTLLKAGKDDDGIERLYAVQSDAVINQAKIAELRSFYHDRAQSVSTPYAASKADSADGVEAALDKANPQWPVFGPVHDNSLAEIGFAVADEKLRLSDGVRTVTLTIDMPAGMPASVHNTFGAALTTSEGWLTLSSELSVSRSGDTLRFVISLSGEHDAIMPYDAAVHGFNFTTRLPLLRIWILPKSGQYGAWQGLSFSSCSLQVAVSGTRAFTLSNDFGAIDITKPRMPFGPQPAINGHLVLGGREIFSKPVSLLELKPVWQEPLGDNSHYSSESLSYSVMADVEWLGKGEWVAPANATPLPMLIHASDEVARGQLALLVLLFLLLGGKPKDYPELLQALLYLMGFGLLIEGQTGGAAYDDLDARLQPSSRQGFVRFTLKNQFGHRDYPQVNALAIMNKASAISGYSLPSGVNADSMGIPKTPYTPVLSSLVLNYQSSAAAPQTFFHQLPFGSLQTASADNRLLSDLSPEGELYIGLKDAQPPQSVSLLFEAIEGSANPLKNPAKLHWHYLKGDTWKPIKHSDVSDTSASLSGSGIMQFELPGDADSEHRILPSQRHWLKLSVDEDSDALCRLSAIHTQAINAIWFDNDNSDQVLAEPLPAGSIAKLQKPDSAIKKVSQPLPSHGGKPEEPDSDYYQRVSERLRHKKRASTLWDYEHLVLQRFAQVYKVRCLNHTELVRDLDNQILADNGMQPGSVVVVPIPIIDSASASDPHRPYNTTRTLADIDAFLRERISPFVKLEVQNPRIEEIQLKFTVAFHEHIIDSGYYSKLLNEEIKQFLMPWSVSDAASIDFNGSWYKSTLVNFIEERAYVDYIKDVQMFHRLDIEDNSTQWQLKDKGMIKASTSRSILVSHASHDITIFAEQEVAS